MSMSEGDECDSIRRVAQSAPTQGSIVMAARALESFVLHCGAGQTPDFACATAFPAPFVVAIKVQ